jgi:PAS domain S-box-containing protein
MPRVHTLPFTWRPRSALSRYALGVALTAAALALTLLVSRWIAPSIFVLFFPAVVAIAWLAGLGPALVSILLIVISVEYFFIAPSLSFAVQPVDLVPLVAFGTVAALISFLSDSARDQAAELQRSRQFLEQAHETAQIGTWEWDVAANRVTWSTQLYRLYGAAEGSPQTFDSFLAAVHPADSAAVRAAVERSFQTREPFAFDHRVVRPDGTVRWLHGRGSVETDDHGRVTRMIGSGQDITDRHRWEDMQAVLAESSATLASTSDYVEALSHLSQLMVRDIFDWCSITLGDSSGAYEVVAVAHKDADRAAWALSAAATEFPPYERRLGHASVLRTGRTEFHPELTTELLRAMSRSPEELRVLQDAGICAMIIVPMIARGRTLGTIAFMSAESRRRFDASDLWLAERIAVRAASAIDSARLFAEATSARLVAENANRAKTDFLAAMSHELRTPLNAIGGYAELLEMGVHGPLNAAQAETLQRLRRAQKSLQALVEDILSFAKVEAGRMEFAITDVPINDLLDRVVDLVEPQRSQRSQQLTVTGREHYPRARADATRVEQILLNLIGNAIKFTPDGGHIAVQVAREGGMVAVAVRDTGVGIPEDQLERVFEPFTQLSPRLDERKPGVGLGLTISRELARRMGGDVRAASRPGEGSTFTLLLPAASRPSAGIPAPEIALAL